MTERRRQFKEYPKLLKLWINNYGVYFEHLKTIPNNKTIRKFKNKYEVFLFSLFYDNMSDFNTPRHLFDSKEAKQLLEDYFKIDL